MPRKILFLSVVVASLVFAQARPRPDAGAPLARPVAAVDAGMPAAAATQGGPTPEADRLRKELNDLKLRTAELERQQQAKADALTAQLEKMSAQLDQMKGQLTKLNDAEDRRSDAEEAAQVKRAATAAANTNLNSALSSLSTGSTGGLDASLRYAESTYSGNAQRYVSLARAALGQGDLTSARGYLILALMEAEAQR